MILMRAAGRTGRIWMTPRGLHGVRPGGIPTGGDFDSPLLNDVTLPDDAATSLLWWLTPPLVDGTSGGTTTVTDDGAYSHADAADGTYVQGYAVRAVEADGTVRSGTGSITITIGAAAQHESGGGDAVVSVVAVGAGTAAEAASGGGDAVVAVIAVGEGFSTESGAQHESGGGDAIVTVVATGAGTAAEHASGGESATVQVIAVGGGISSEGDPFVMPELRNLVHEPAEQRWVIEPAETRYIPR